MLSAFVRTAIMAMAVHVALAPAFAQSDTVDADKGRRLAETLCLRCHLNKGQGEKQGPMGIPGFVAVANRPNQTFDEIIEWLKTVPPMMPDHHLTQDEIYDLAAYIMTLRKPQ